jgi:hypothetical protein
LSIQAVSAYRVGERVFPTIEEAQASEIYQLLIAAGGLDSEGNATKAAQLVVAHTDEIVAILTCQPKSKSPRRPRSDIGKKRAKKDATPAVL